MSPARRPAVRHRARGLETRVRNPPRGLSPSPVTEETMNSPAPEFVSLKLDQIRPVTTSRASRPRSADPRSTTAADCFALICELVAARLSQNWGAQYAQADSPQDRDFWQRFGVDKAKLMKLAEQGKLQDEPGDGDDQAEEKPATKAKGKKKRKVGAA